MGLRFSNHKHDAFQTGEIHYARSAGKIAISTNILCILHVMYILCTYICRPMKLVSGLSYYLRNRDRNSRLFFGVTHRLLLTLYWHIIASRHRSVRDEITHN